MFQVLFGGLICCVHYVCFRCFVAFVVRIGLSIGCLRSVLIACLFSCFVWIFVVVLFSYVI